MVHQAESGRIRPDKKADALLQLDPLRGRRIAVIEADRHLLKDIGNVLSDWGCEVISGNNAETLINEHRNKTPDLILAGYRLAQGRNGMGEIIALCLHFNRNIPAGLIAKDLSPEIHEEIESSGYGLIVRPFAHLQLRAMLTDLVNR